MKTPVKIKVDPVLAATLSAQREAEAAKTARLRALRLAKEAADKEAAARDAAAVAATPRPRRRQRLRHEPVPPVT